MHDLGAVGEACQALNEVRIKLTDPPGKKQGGGSQRLDLVP